MVRWFVGVVATLSLACSSGGDDATGNGGGSGSGGSGAGGGSGGVKDAGCDVGLPDGACPGIPGGGGGGNTGGTGAGGGTSCEGAGLLECPANPLEYWDVCDRVAYECNAGVGLGYTSSTQCDALNSTGTPMCCVPWEKQCDKLQAVDCAALGGVADCFKCRDDNGAAYDENNCKDTGAACTTNNECCKRCCRSDGSCS